MKITVINGTEKHGVTYRMKEMFLVPFKDTAEITEYYLPKDCPNFCAGCTACFLKDQHLCKDAEYIQKIERSNEETVDIAIRLCLFAMKTQVFIDGNKRAAVIFANHYLISRGEGLLVIPEKAVPQFKKLLIKYYETDDAEKIKVFLKEKCWRKP